MPSRTQVYADTDFGASAQGKVNTPPPPFRLNIGQRVYYFHPTHHSASYERAGSCLEGRQQVRRPFLAMHLFQVSFSGT